jgi:hypothetical protein
MQRDLDEQVGTSVLVVALVENVGGGDGGARLHGCGFPVSRRL